MLRTFGVLLVVAMLVGVTWVVINVPLDPLWGASKTLLIVYPTATPRWA